MKTDLLNRLDKAIGNYERQVYNEHDFHSTLESIIQSITEFDLNDLRLFLLAREADLQLADFTINKSDMRVRYLLIIKQINDYLRANEI